jgi:hypothetical protein
MAEKPILESVWLEQPQTQRMMEEAQLRQGWLNGGGKLEDAGYEKELAALRNMPKKTSCAAIGRPVPLVDGMSTLKPPRTPMTLLKNVASSTLTGLSDMLPNS